MVDAHAGGPPAAGTTDVATVVRQILAGMAPEQLGLVGVVEEELLAPGRGGHRAMRQALRGRSADEPTGFGVGESLATLVPIVVVVVNGVATSVLSAHAQRKINHWGARWRRRTRARRLASERSPQGPAALLPKMSSLEAADVGRQAREVALDAGVPEEQAQRIATLLAAALTVPATP